MPSRAGSATRAETHRRHRRRRSRLGVRCAGMRRCDQPSSATAALGGGVALPHIRQPRGLTSRPRPPPRARPARTPVGTGTRARSRAGPSFVSPAIPSVRITRGCTPRRIRVCLGHVAAAPPRPARLCPWNPRSRTHGDRSRPSLPRRSRRLVRPSRARRWRGRARRRSRRPCRPLRWARRVRRSPCRDGL